MKRATVAYEIVTEDSAAFGAAQEQGYISHSEPLRYAVADLMDTRTAEVDNVESIDATVSEGTTIITINNGREFRTGAWESRSLYINCTLASGKRLARLIGARV